MSEPRKLNTGDAQRTVYHAGDAQRSVNTANSRSVLTQEQYEAARRRAQEMANRTARTRRTAQVQKVQQSDIDAYRAAQAQAQAQARAEAEAQLNAQPQPAAPTAYVERNAGLTRAQQQAMELRRRAERNRVADPAPQKRTIHRAAPSAAQANVRQLDLKNTQPKKTAYDFDGDKSFEESAPRAPKAEPQAAAPKKTTIKRSDAPAAAASKPSPKKPGGKGGNGGNGGNGGKGGKPPKPPKKGKGAPPRDGDGKQKKKGSWWKVVLATLLAIVLIFGGTFALIMHAIAPEAGSISISDLINTPKEYQGKELNILITGVDRSTTSDLSAGAANDENVNDGLTDMVMWVHFNNETGELKMLQIPRDTMVTTDTSVSSNYRINGVAKTQGSDNNNNMAALCELVAEQYQIPIDGYMTIRLEMLVELVDLFGGLELNVPVEMDYEGSHLSAGYQTLDGAACEFLIRTRKIYPDGDIGRLNMQRQFYSALFRKLKSIGNVWDVAKLTPAVLNYLETDLNASQLISFAVSLLGVDSSKIMICQMPVYVGPTYYDQALVYPARQEDADLLNTYFRENTGAVDASELNLCDNAVDLSGLTATDPNIQYMGSIMEQDAAAQQENNLDGSHMVEGAFVETTDDEAASDEAASSEPAA